MAIRTELSLRLKNSPGEISQICQHLLDERINIFALNLEAGGMLRLVADNPLNAAGTLRNKQYSLTEREVLSVQLPNNPGALQNITDVIFKAGKNIDYRYASALEDHSIVVLIVAVEDVQRVAMATGL